MLDKYVIIPAYSTTAVFDYYETPSVFVRLINFYTFIYVDSSSIIQFILS